MRVAALAWLPFQFDGIEHVAKNDWDWLTANPIDNVMAIIEGQPPPNCVNPEVFAPKAQAN
jgi:hypothetical protein